jgi:cytosine/adenosine deaminase-related metal-dependent hydrolase
LLRGAALQIAPPTDFTQNLQRIWWPVDEALTAEEAHASALVAGLELLRTGTTTLTDTYSGPRSIAGVLDDIERAIDTVGLRGVIAFEATQRHSAEEGFRGLDENARFLQRHHPGRVRGMVSVHASFTASDELLRRAVGLSTEFRAPLTMHACEGLGDTYHNLERYGKRTLERLAGVGFLRPQTVLAHCVHVNADELGLLKTSGAHVAHNPMSNMLNAVGAAPVPDMMRLGINIGLGNDGYVLDVFENMRAAFLLHRAFRRDPRGLTPEEVVEMATVNAAKCYGLDELGSLEVGKRGDIVVLKPELLPTPLTSSSVYGHLVNTISGRDVDTVIVDGEPLIEGRQPVRLSVARVARSAQSAAARLWGRLRRVRAQLDVLPLTSR